YDWPTQAASISIPVFHGLRPRLIVETSSIERRILNVFVGAAVPIVRPALGDHVNGSESIAILRGCVARIDTNLANGIKRHVVIAAVVISRCGGSRPVRQKVHVVGLGPVDPDLLTGGFTRPISVAASSAGVYSGNKLSH